MEFNNCISQLNKVIKKLRLEQGNEDNEKAFEALSPIFLQNSSENRRIMYYLVLNSDHGVTAQLLDDHSVGLFIKVSPEIKLDWVVSVSVKFNTLRFLLEIISYSASGIIIPLLKTLTDCPDVLINVALYENIMKNALLRIYEPGRKGAVSEEYMKCFETILKKLVKTICETLVSSDTKKSGELVHVFLGLMTIALEQKCLIPNQELCDFYALDKDYSLRNDHVTEVGVDIVLKDWFIKEIESILQLIHFNIWISWTEECLFGTGCCLQTVIGNEIYNLCEIINRKGLQVPKEVLQCLNHLKVKPISEEQIIAELSIENLVKTIKDKTYKDDRKWYEALAMRNEAWESNQIVSLMLENVDRYSSSEKILELYVSSLKTKNCGAINSYLEILKNIDTDVQLQILKRICSENDLSLFHPTKVTTDIVEEFNKLSVDVSNDKFFQKTIYLFIQRPVEVMSKIFQYAITLDEFSSCIEMFVKLRCVVNVANFIDPASEKLVTNVNIFEFVFKQTFIDKSLQEKQYIASIAFLHDLQQVNIVPSTFASQFILPSLEHEVINRNWNRSRYLLQLFEVLKCGSADSDDVRIKLVPLLSFLCQILSETEWDMDSFDTEKAAVYEITARNVSRLLKEEESDLLMDSNLQWLKNFLNPYSNIVRTHFSPLLYDKNAAVYELSNLLLLTIRGNMDSKGFVDHCHTLRAQTDFFFAIVKVIIFLLPWEWEKLEDICRKKSILDFPSKDSATHNILTFKTLAKALAVFCHCSDSNHLLIVERCMSNFSYLFDYHVNNLPPECVLKLLKHFLIPLNSLRDDKIRNKLYLVNIPLMRTALKSCGELSEKLLESVRSQIHEDWRSEFKFEDLSSRKSLEKL